QAVEVDAPEDPTDDTPVRRAAIGRSVVPIFEISGPQQSLDQGGKTPIADLLAENRHQDPVVDVVKAPLDIALDEPGRVLPGVVHLVERGMAASLGSEAVGPVAELRLVVRLQDGAHDLLQ